MFRWTDSHSSLLATRSVEHHFCLRCSSPAGPFARPPFVNLVRLGERSERLDLGHLVRRAHQRHFSAPHASLPQRCSLAASDRFSDGTLSTLPSNDRFRLSTAQDLREIRFDSLPDGRSHRSDQTRHCFVPSGNHELRHCSSSNGTTDAGRIEFDLRWSNWRWVRERCLLGRFSECFFSG